MTPLQRKALTQALNGRIRAPATGAFRSRSGSEVDRVWCYSKRTIKPLIDKGWLAADCGGYVITCAGKVALG